MSIYICTYDMDEMWIDLKYNKIKPMYMISTYGNIKNKNNNKLLKGSIDRKGYIGLMLKNIDGGITKCRMHRLVATSFIKDLQYIGNTVNHKDGDKLNNHICNLEWMTNNQNVEHARLLNLIHIGDQCHNATLTNSQVKEICILLEKGQNYSEIINNLFLNDSRAMRVALSRIKRRLSFVHISKEYKWQISNKLHDKINKICSYVKEGYTQNETLLKLGLSDNSVNRDIFRNIRNQIITS